MVHRGGGQGGERLRWRTSWSRSELEASEERQAAAQAGCTPVAEVGDRHRARVFGVLRSVTLRARQTVPALEAELYDGTGAVHVVWLGQRRIEGIEPGRRLRLEGLVCDIGGRRTMFNPRYELAPRAQS